MGRSERALQVMRQEVEALRLEKLNLLRQLEFLVEQSNRDTLRLAELEGSFAQEEEATDVDSRLFHM
jgi:hypothetical protein